MSLFAIAYDFKLRFRRSGSYIYDMFGVIQSLTQFDESDASPRFSQHVLLGIVIPRHIRAQP